MTVVAIKFVSDAGVFYDADCTRPAAQPIVVSGSLFDLPALYLKPGARYQVMFRFSRWWPFNFWVKGGESFVVPQCS